MLGNRQVAHRDVTVMNSNWLVAVSLAGISKDIYKQSQFSVDFGCFVFVQKWTGFCRCDLGALCVDL